MITAGIDVGASYTKGLLVDDRGIVLAQAMRPTGFKLTQVAREVFDTCLGQAGLNEAGCSYVIATGVGRYQCDFKDLTVTELTAVVVTPAIDHRSGADRAHVA